MNTLIKRVAAALACAFILASCASVKPIRESSGLPAAILFSSATAPSVLRVLVLSDVHGYDVEGLVSDRAAWERYRANHKKPSDYSFEKVKAVLSSVGPDSGIDLVIFPGDLTVNGEKASHGLLAGVLAAFESSNPSGASAWVAAGNHDVRNPRAKEIGPLWPSRAETVSAGEFASIYADFGYGEALSRDAASLSYAAEPVPGVLLLVLDTARWYDNRFFPVRLSVADGAIRPGTLAWAEAVLSEARSKGKLIVAVQHHPFADPAYSDDRQAEGFDEMERLYREYGASIVIAGHKHKYFLNADSRPVLLLAPNVSVSSGNSVLVEMNDGAISVRRDPFALSAD